MSAADAEALGKLLQSPVMNTLIDKECRDEIRAADVHGIIMVQLQSLLLDSQTDQVRHMVCTATHGTSVTASLRVRIALDVRLAAVLYIGVRGGSRVSSCAVVVALVFFGRKRELKTVSGRTMCCCLLCNFSSKMFGRVPVDSNFCTPNLFASGGMLGGQVPGRC